MSADMKWPANANPSDLADYAHLSHEMIAEHYGVHRRTVAKWFKRAGIDRKNLISGLYRGDAPEGYAAIAPTKTVPALMAQFGVSKHVIRRWDKAVGHERVQMRGKAYSEPVRRVSTVPTYMTAPVDRPHIDMSYAGRAAEYLRKYGPVIRCDANGRFDIAGTHWRRGSTLLDAAQIVDRAVRNGFDADAWKRVA